MATTSEEMQQEKFLELQHQYRGLIANFRSRKFVESQQVSPANRFRSSESNWLLEARAAVPIADYRRLLGWTEQQRSTQLLELQHTPIAFSELSGVYATAPEVNLYRELSWICERFRLQKMEITNFVRTAALIQDHVFNGKYEQAIELIAAFQTSCGVSLWSVQLRLAVEQLAGGLERQKRYSAEVRKVYKQGLLGFITYHSSVRNEDRTTLPKFFESVDGRIERHSKYDASLKTYMRYRLKRYFPQSEKGLADILRIEQSHGIIDLYETFIAVLQELTGGQLDLSSRQYILGCLSHLNIDDFRLGNIARALNVEVDPKSTGHKAGISDQLFAGHPVNAARLAARAVKQGSKNPWDYIYGAFAFGHATRNRAPRPIKPTDITRLIGRAVGRTEGATEAWSQAAKLTLNLRGLPLAAGLFEFCLQMQRTSPTEGWQPWLIGLNSSVSGPEDSPWNIGCWREAPSKLLSDQVWYEACCPGDSKSYPFRLARAAGHIHRGDYSKASDELLPVSDDWPLPLSKLRALHLLHALFEQGRRQEVVELIAREGAVGAQQSKFLPVVATLQNYSWHDYKLVNSPLAAPISLHLLWANDEKSIVASQMRYATGHSLRKAGVQLPSAILDQKIEASLAEIVYFLKYLCVPDILDLTRLFSGTREILEERQAVCSLLIEIDPSAAEIYEIEIFTIANDLALDEGRRIVDSTRIHVDSEAFLRWALRSLAEDYDRYHDLESVTGVEAQNFNDVLEEISSQLSQRTSFEPKTEADAVLLSILHRLGDEFLTNATFGLDFYLSKRVRHQSFIGLIRGPLEFSSLITTRISESGEYHRNDHWIEAFTNVGEQSRQQIDMALRNFASAFDDVLTKAKDNFFHLRSPDKPQGMLFLSLEERLVLLARRIIKLDYTFSEFLLVATPIMWAALEPALSNIRIFITDVLKPEVAKEFDVVRAAIRASAEHDPAFLAFDAAMGKGSSEVQLKLDEASHWFVHADTLKKRRLFTLEQMLRISIDTALKTQRGYEPIINQITEGDLSLPPPELVFLHDVVFVGLGNAQKHSGLKTPKIDIGVRHDPDDQTITLQIISDCRPTNRAIKEKQTVEIREAIESGSHLPRTRKEGYSGFAKLAAIVGQSGHNKLDFGFMTDGRFRLAVTFGIRFV